MSNKVGHPIIDNNKRQSPRPSFAWISGSGTTDAGASLLRLSLLTSGILLVSLALMTTTSLGQEENDTTTVSSLGMDFSPHPIWDEVVITTCETPINETHTIVTFIGNGTMTVPDTGKTINMTNNGTAIISPVTGSPGTVSAYGRESVFSEDGDTIAITFHEIIQSDSSTPQGKGVGIAVFDRNATGLLAPFNGMIAAGTHDAPLNPEEANVTLWEWQQ
jgi:hypothetical protein